MSELTTDCGLPLPCSSSVFSPGQPAFLVSNSGEGVGAIAILGETVGQDATGVSGTSAGSGDGVRGSSDSGTGVVAESRGGPGVTARSRFGPGVLAFGVYGVDANSDSSEPGAAAVHGHSSSGIAGRFEVERESNKPALDVLTRGSWAGIEARAGEGPGGYFYSQDGAALSAYSPFGWGALIVGEVDVFGDAQISGTLRARAKQFVIDHPLDPRGKELVHASVESSELSNVYSGNVVLDENGEGIVELAPWVEALNGDFRYQLTCIGEFAPTYVAEPIQDGRFKIAGGRPGMTVSWQVTGIRRDAWAQAHPLVVEREKAPAEVGSYHSPVEHGENEEAHIMRTRHRDLMERSRELRERQQAADPQSM